MRLQTASDESTQRCRNCIYYIQHYVLWDKKGKKEYTECGSGHCVQSRVKYARPDCVCDMFEANKGKPKGPFSRKVQRKNIE